MSKNLLSIFCLFSMYGLSAQQDVMWEKSIGGEQAEYDFYARLWFLDFRKFSF